MTTRRVERIWTADVAGARNSLLTEFFELVHDEKLDQTEILSFEIAADSPKADDVLLDGEIQWRDRKFYVFEREPVRDGSEARIRVEAQALWYRLGETVRPGSTVLTSVTTSAGLETIVSGTGWTVGSRTTSSSSTFSLSEEDSSVLALIRKWALVTNTKIQWDTSSKTISLVSSRGADLGNAFRYASNLISIRRTEQPPAATRLFPYGRDGLSILGLEGAEYVEDLSYYTDQGIDAATARTLYGKDRIWSKPEFLADVELLAAANSRLAELSIPAVSYECRVVDLAEITGIAEKIRVGDSVRVSDSIIGVDVRVTCVRLKRFPLEPWRNEIELSYLPPTMADSSSSQRSSFGAEWNQFISDGSQLELRADGTFTVNRIPLRFSEGGEANFHHDIFVIGVGSGTLGVTAYDADETTPSAIIRHRVLSLPYGDGDLIHENVQWAEETLTGQKDYRIRAQAVATGGADAASGVDIAAAESRFWIMARGAVRETPVLSDSIRFDYVSDAVQSWTVPDNVTEITVEAVGAAGGSGDGGGAGGAGGKVTATFPVTPGTEFDVYAGEKGNRTGQEAGGWYGGGQGGGGSGTSDGGGAGGLSALIPKGTVLPAGIVNALIVAAGGGGGGASGASAGGDGHFVTGEDGADAEAGAVPGGGAGTQTAGGAAGGGDATSGGLADGGDGATHSAFTEGGGGGGSGKYGGGGGDVGGTAGAGGGGGSGHVDSSGYDIEAVDGFNSSENGHLLISWTAPSI